MKSKHILMVEDDQQINKMVCEALATQNYEVTSFFTAVAAMDYLQNNTPNLIISDIMMPEIDGYGFLYRLRVDRRLRHIPVIFLSALGKVDEQLKGLELGAIDYITKPFRISDLLAKVIFALRTQEREAERYARQKNLSGSLAQVDIVTLIQMMEQNQKTGLLTVTNDRTEAILYFHEGQIIDAVLGSHGGETAVYQLIGWEEGHFEFEQQSIDMKPRIKSTTAHIILEGLRLLDEAANTDSG